MAASFSTAVYIESPPAVVFEALGNLETEVVPERSGSNVELTGDIRMPGIWALFARFMTRMFKKACHTDLEALKKHLESPWAATGRA